ncbi:MAG: AmmeMemoRadiSam system protein B [Bacteroidetes bacterium]|nr:AmmeMemoRadiSam system protein B [Bacteroidota bacterium]
MQKSHSWFWLLFLFFFVTPGCRSQDQKTTRESVDRPMAVAGSFYPSDPAELRTLLGELFSDAKPPALRKTVIAVICPHAGYVFSGTVAASSYNQLSPDKQYDNIFIIGSSHHVSFMGASIYNIGDYQTPLGKVKVNVDLANKLIRENAVFSYNPEADRKEHSIEVQLPFLQYYLKNSFNLVPIVLGTQSAESCRKIAKALKPYLGGNNLFVISSDFSHYPPYNDALTVDKSTCDAILTNQPDNLLKVLKENDEKNVPNLATSLCGWTSVLTLLYMTENDPAVTMKAVHYQNSGDSKYKDKSQVVGYWSIIAAKTVAPPAPSPGFNLSKKDKKELLKIARTTIEQYIRSNKTPSIDPSGFSEILRTSSGAFVTLKEGGSLRGCIGRFTAEEPLYQVVQQMAIASSTQDNRFSPVDPGEINKISIEISVLSPMKKISSIDEIILGKHGIYIKKGYSSGTFLPQVATETGWNKEEFLGHCARDKAGLDWNGWKGADIYIYEAVVFSEEDINGRKD